MVKDVSGQELEKLIEAGAILVDVRENQTSDSHKPLPGHTHIPLSALHEKLPSLAQERAKIFYCRSGLLSFQAAEIVSSKTNSETYYIDGGLIKYYEQ